MIGAPPHRPILPRPAMIAGFGAGGAQVHPSHRTRRSCSACRPAASRRARRPPPRHPPGWRSNRSCCGGKRRGDLCDDRARRTGQVVPGEPQHDPTRADQRVALAAVVGEAILVDVPGPTVDLDRDPGLEERKVDQVGPRVGAPTRRSRLLAAARRAPARLRNRRGRPPRSAAFNGGRIPPSDRATVGAVHLVERKCRCSARSRNAEPSGSATAASSAVRPRPVTRRPRTW